METMRLRVADLLAIDGLATSLLAGEAGLARPVAWAHSCELGDPWQWLGRDELLMTLGLGLPREPAAQVRFLRRLAEASLAGIMLGARAVETVVSREMLAEADRLGFPLLRTEASVPWSAVSRHVSAANQGAQTIEVLALAQLYELSAGAEDPDAFATGIARLFRIGIEVSEVRDGIRLFGSAPAAWSEPDSERERDRVHRVSGRHALQIRVRERSDTRLSAMALVHLKRVIEVEADRILLRAGDRAAAEEQALRALLTARDPEPGVLLLPADAARGEFRILAVPEAQLAALSRHSAVRQLPVLAGRYGGDGLVLVPAGQLDALRELTGQLGLPGGLSSPGHELREAAGLAPEASSALRSSGTRPGWTEYRGNRLGMLIRSDQEAESILAESFGALAEPGERADTLRATLCAYLRNERSWARSSTELGIHRQTLAYRLRTIESITGRSLARTEDLVALWLGTQAWRRLRGEPSDESTKNRSYSSSNTVATVAASS